MKIAGFTISFFLWVIPPIIHISINFTRVNHVNFEIASKTFTKRQLRLFHLSFEKMITNTSLAEQLGVSKMTISRWCTNATQPSAPQLIEISQILQCDLKDLYEPFE